MEDVLEDMKACEEYIREVFLIIYDFIEKEVNEMITKRYIPSANGCGYWELENSNGTVITADDNDSDIKEAIMELEEDENRE